MSGASSSLKTLQRPSNPIPNLCPGCKKVFRSDAGLRSHIQQTQRCKEIDDKIRTDDDATRPKFVRKTRLNWDITEIPATNDSARVEPDDQMDVDYTDHFHDDPNSDGMSFDQNIESNRPNIVNYDDIRDDDDNNDWEDEDDVEQEGQEEQEEQEDWNSRGPPPAPPDPTVEEYHPNKPRIFKRAKGESILSFLL